MIGSKILVDAIGYSQLFLDLLGGKNYGTGCRAKELGFEGF